MPAKVFWVFWGMLTLTAAPDRSCGTWRTWKDFMHSEGQTQNRPMLEEGSNLGNLVPRPHQCRIKMAPLVFWLDWRDFR